MFNPDLYTQLAPLAFKSAVGLVITGVIMWPFRKARKEWTALKEEQAAIHKELVHQRTNCLTTLQQQGATMVDLQTKTVDLLQGVRIDLAEQTGYLKAFVPAPRIRKAAAKK